jgi:hypothetical protein
MPRRIPRSCMGFLAHGILRPVDYRELLALGLKYTLPPEMWDSVVECSTSDRRVAEMQEAFNHYTSARMRSRTHVTDKCIRQYIGYWYDLHRPDCSPALRRKRLRVYTNWIRRRMKKAGYSDRTSLMPLVPFARCVERLLRNNSSQ